MVYFTKAYRAKKEKVSAWLIIVTGLIYLYIGIEQGVKGNVPMAVNTAMQRCLAKAIALHGIGLYIYSGEDIPESEQPTLKAVSSKDFL